MTYNVLTGTLNRTNSLTAKHLSLMLCVQVEGNILTAFNVIVKNCWLTFVDMAYASEAAALWRYRSFFIIIIII